MLAHNEIMKISTFEEDLFGLVEFAHRLEKFIATEHDYVEGSLVIALTSKYGSGKTTFLEMWKASLENEDETTDKPLVISLNAWESDYYGDPLFAIISALIECLQAKNKPVNGLVNAVKDFGWFTTAVGSQIVNKVTGIDAVAAGELAQRKKGERKKTAQTMPDSFSIYQSRKVAMESLKREIELFVSASKPRVLFLVDELDRCKPDYAITYLETIKHIFDIKGAVFLLAADRKQLENSAKTAFGPNLDFEEYYRKFIHREITLPPISTDGYKKLAFKYVSYYLEREGERHCFMKLEHNRVENISELISALKLTPRQIQEVFRVLGHIFSTSEQNKGRLLWCLAVGSIVMATLKIGDPRIFHLLGTQQLDSKEAVDYFKYLVGKDDVKWWFMLLLTGGGIRMDEGESVSGLMIREGFAKEEDEMNTRIDVGQWRQGWGGSGRGRITEIHNKIEQISQWN